MTLTDNFNFRTNKYICTKYLLYQFSQNFNISYVFPTDKAVCQVFFFLIQLVIPHIDQGGGIEK